MIMDGIKIKIKWKKVKGRLLTNDAETFTRISLDDVPFIQCVNKQYRTIQAMNK